MKKTYQKPTADWISFRVSEELADLEVTASVPQAGTGGGLIPRLAVNDVSTYQLD